MNGWPTKATTASSIEPHRVNTRAIRGDCTLVRDLRRFLPAIHTRLRAHDAWTAYRVTDPETGHTYDRLLCKTLLKALDSGTRYQVAAHVFHAPPVGTAMHDHRHPFAILPLALDGRVGQVVYRMPWQLRKGEEVIESGVLDVKAGRPYAIEQPKAVWHAVFGTAPHLSLVIADVSQPPTRAARSAVAALGDTATQTLCATALRTLDAFDPRA